MPLWACRRGGKSLVEQACSPASCRPGVFSSCWVSETRVLRHPESPVPLGGEAPDRITAGGGAGILLGPLCVSTTASGSGLQLLCPPQSPLQPPGCGGPRRGSHGETEARDQGPPRPKWKAFLFLWLFLPGDIHWDQGWGQAEPP